MELYERIKSLRLQHSMTQKELGNYINVSEMSVRNWETGIKKPSIPAVIAMAEIFNVTTDYLLGVNIEPDKDNLLLNQHEIILLSNYRVLDKYGRKAVDTLCVLEKSRVEAEKPKQKADIIPFDAKPSRYIPRYTTPSAAGYSAPLDGDDFEMILVDDNIPANADFAVSIQGNSMYPYIKDGDTVYVNKDCELSIGDVGIFCVDGAMYCKQYFIDEDKNLILVSANPRLKNTNIFIEADSEMSVRCYGKVLLDYKIDLPSYISE